MCKKSSLKALLSCLEKSFCKLKTFCTLMKPFFRAFSQYVRAPRRYKYLRNSPEGGSKTDLSFADHGGNKGT